MPRQDFRSIAYERIDLDPWIMGRFGFPTPPLFRGDNDRQRQLVATQDLLSTMQACVS